MKKIIIVIALFIGQMIYANDSAGTTSAGGIQFQRSPSIVMESEHLTVSMDQIKVEYQFKNISDKSITKNILFPLPPYKPLGANAVWDNEVEPGANKNNAPFLNFSVYVNQQPVPFKMITRALEQNKDVTNILLKNHLPLNPDLVAGKIPMANYSEVTDWQATAKRLGLLDKKNQPLWQKQIIYIWQQTFPAKQIINIMHVYKPAMGEFYGYRILIDKNENKLIKDDITRIQQLFNFDLATAINGANINQNIKSRVQKAKQLNKVNCINFQPNDNGCLYAFYYNLQYILTTGANWSGPIRQFQLTVLYPSNCYLAINPFYDATSVKIQQKPGIWQLSANNFLPKNDLNVLLMQAEN